MLMNLIQHQKLIEGKTEYSREKLEKRINNHGFNFIRYLKVLIQYTVKLYYPPVLVYL
ncbi:hypothetical protein K502DRAFT_324490 [Neoconidiobolus thromboides FSU 785]|nr:hypothetical protein K502DRAFT_324490 [Neoconidiobolus thromboides FSU 785]